MAKSKNGKTSPDRTGDGGLIPPRYRHIAWACLAGLWLLTAAALVSFHPGDWPNHAVAPHNRPTANWVGAVGAWTAYKTYLMIGPGVWLIMAGIAAYLLTTAAGKRIDQLVLRFIGITVMGLAASAIAGLALPGAGVSNQPEGAGGLLAIFINTELVRRFAFAGTMVIHVIAFWIGAILAVDRLVMAVPQGIGAAGSLFARIKMPRPVLVGKLSGLALPLSGWGRRAADKPLSERAQLAAQKRAERKRKLEAEDEDGNHIDADAGGLGATESFDPEAQRRGAAVAVVAEDRQDAGVSVDDEEDVDDEEALGVGDAPGAYLESKKQFDPEALRAKIKQLPINFAGLGGGKKATAPPREVDLSGYKFPGLDILSDPESNFTTEMEKLVRDQAVELESAMQQYRIEGEVVGIDSGPVITLYEVRLAAGTRVNSLNNIASDLARALRAQNIRIVPNMAGKDTVGIEVPNHMKEKVRLKELMTHTASDVQKMKLPMFLGKDASGNPLVQDLAAMPHMLIAGTTGSGKSVCMNSIIMSFLYTKRPDELKLVLVDPKMVEMSLFKDVPHLMCPVVTEMAKAAAILEWATTKMDERYELLAEAGVRDVPSYNALSWEELCERMKPATEAEEARIPKKLPFLVFIIDELADLMMTNKEVEGFIVRLAQKSRAVGMHLILATQRPQANVVTGLIKSNMPARIAFKVASGMDSRIVLDQKGAELLLGHGDMLYLSPRSSKLTRAQGTLVDDLEIRQCVKFLKEIAEQNFEPQLIQIRGGGEVAVDEEAAKDPLFDDAVRVVLQSKRGSVSLLQRRLTIGYSRASRLIEAMAAAGILGEHKGSQAREIAMTIEEYEAIRAQAAQDAEDGMSSAPAPGSDEADEGEDGGVPDEFDDEYKN
jgi:S-DNA-T family DNA segregation ATPase FtsK/SpoIIIE